MQRTKDESSILKARLVEADKNRDLFIREISTSKDQENMRIREVEQKKDAQVKLIEKMNETLKQDKKELEMRLEEAILKQDLISSKYAEEHHNTVKYFESLISQYKNNL